MSEIEHQTVTKSLFRETHELLDFSGVRSTATRGRIKIAHENCLAFCKETARPEYPIAVRVGEYRANIRLYYEIWLEMKGREFDLLNECMDAVEQEGKSDYALLYDLGIEYSERAKKELGLTLIP